MTAENTPFSVDLAEVEQVISRLAGLAGFLADHIDQIDAKVSTLLGGTAWEGAAAQAYGTAQQQWSAGARQFVDGVREMSAAARTAHDSYTEAGAVNTRLFRGR
ncbi:WXG100 family type VII secretion target [Nocardia harenae]|uniref:WXG100 family type VII secretion target n=1 Tax=Nocardia harenae TaxID=358707 RepID=UPI000A0387F6|nr:WXG100 family type VII secretion target [Nocardia harenae]